MIEILMASYNGAAYIGEQIDSILAGAGAGTGEAPLEWRLTVGDDASSDATVDMVRGYEARYPGRIRLSYVSDVNMGAMANFIRLIRGCRAPYAMFSDQDDVWLPRKIGLTMDEMLRLEGLHGAGTPILVHTDLRVVDGALGEISPSFMSYQHIDPRADGLRRLAMQNAVTGCTAMVNRALLEALLWPGPGDSPMYDWWLALTASALGRIGYVPEATVLYRQHGANEIGAKAYDGGGMTIGGTLGRLARDPAYPFGREFAMLRARKHADLAMKQRQAGAFARAYAGRLSLQDREALAGFGALEGRGWLARRAFVIRHGFFERGLKRNLGVMLAI